MAQTDEKNADAPKKRGKLPLILGVVGAFLFGAGGFYASYKDLIPFGHAAESTHEPIGPLPEIAFVPLDPIVISLGPAAGARHLRFSAQLEVPLTNQAEVSGIRPRVIDVLNSYLRAVDVATLEDPTAMMRIKAQMLRRIQIVTGEGRVRDLLISEFVLN